MKTRKALVQIIGWMFLVGGIAGLFLPFLQGILFILTGLVILSSQYEWARNVFEMARNRFPKAAGQLDGFLQKIWKLFPFLNRESQDGK